MSFEIRAIIIVAIICIILACTSWIALEFVYLPCTCGAEQVGAFVLGLLLVLSLLGIIACVSALVCNMIWRWW